MKKKVREQPQNTQQQYKVNKNPLHAKLGQKTSTKQYETSQSRANQPLFNLITALTSYNHYHYFFIFKNISN